jgi:hypothetical protein
VVISSKKYIKIYINVFILLILLAGMGVGIRLVRQPKEVDEEKAAGITINDFKVPLSTMLSRYGKTKHVQLFGGSMVLAEFDDANNNLYAGHLGGFWAPPFFSTHTTAPLNNPGDWQKGFNHGLVFYNVGYGGGAAEQPTDIGSEEAYWYPSKIVLSHLYPGGGGGTLIRGVKVALPNERGMGLKVTLTNKTTTSQSMNLLFLGSLPTFNKLTSWSSTTEAGWNWQGEQSTRSQTSTSYDSSYKIIVISDPNGSYMAMGLSNYTTSWGANNDPHPMYEYFLGNGKGNLASTNADTSSAGSAFGLVAGLPSLSQNQSATVTIIIGVGSSATEAKNIVINNRGKDIESASDSFWNSRINSVFSNLPFLTSGDPNLNQLYQNAVMTYLVNRWQKPDGLGEAAAYGQSTSVFPWFVGTTGVLPLIDSGYWKTQLNKMLSLNLDTCRAYDNVSGIHLCDTKYSYSKYSLVDAVYKYIATTGDFSYLNSSLYNKLNGYVAADDSTQGSDGLVDFGSDLDLYEYNIRCSLGGNYTGKVISPNAERVVAHRELADMAERIGQSGSTHRNKAVQIKNSIQTLWNSSANWFDTINLYDANGNKTSPTRKTFRSIVPYLLMQYDDLLTSTQINTLKSQMSNYTGTYGFTSLPKDSTWCEREDWQGPGLYSGAVGAVLTGLFNNGAEDYAYSMLSKYSYLSQVPYYSQAFPHNRQSTVPAYAYLEGVSMAQAVISGLFGVEPNFDHTKIRPNIPSSLRSKGSLSLTGLNMQGHTWDIVINSLTNHSLTMNMNSGGSRTDHFRLGYKINGTLNLTVRNLIALKTYKITATPVSGGNAVSVNVNSNSSGVIAQSLSLNGDYVVVGEPYQAPTNTPTNTPTPKPTATNTPTNTPTSTKTPTPTTIPGDLNGSGSVDINDYNLLVNNFGNSICGNTADITGDCKVDIYDYNILLTNFGK